MPSSRDPSPGVPQLARRHLRIGWWFILVFAAAGLTLEGLHAFKVREYLDVSNDTRRLMWTLAHAHGALLGVLNILFGVTLAATGAAPARPGQRLTSQCLIAAAVLLPAGFLLGGLVVYGGDPGPGVVLVPIGGILLIVALVRIAREIR